MTFSMSITPFKRGRKHTLELEEFKPTCGFENFIKDFTSFDGDTDYLFEFDWNSGQLLRYVRPPLPW